MGGGGRQPTGAGRRVLVTGASGLLGRKLLAALRAWPGWQPLAAGRQPPSGDVADVPFYACELRDAPSVEAAVAAATPEVVIHTAALTDVDGCERQPELAWAVNVTGTEHVAAACAHIGARLVHLSTEYIFDGTAGPYREDDPPNPLGVYARTKLASEERAAALCPRWIVGRTTVLYGYAPGARANFALWLLERLRRGEVARVVDDQIGSPTLADNLAEMLLALVEIEADGVYHTVGATRVSRYEFALQLVRVFDLDAGLVRPISTADLRQPAPRPLRAGLLTDRYEATCPETPPLTLGAALTRLRAQLAGAGTR